MEQQIKTIRIFISSTFKDMHSERDYLVKNVFPELRERCIRRNLSLVDVDLRWGVTEEEAEQGRAIEICLDEIENCKPFFIGILGERYGWTPEKYHVPDHKKYDWLKKFEKGHSITSIEIYHGVLNQKEMKPRAFFYFRDPSVIQSIPQSKQHEIRAESEILAKKLSRLKQDIKDAFNAHNVSGHVMENYSCEYKGLKINLQLVREFLSSGQIDQDFSLLEKIIGDENLIDNKKYQVLTDQQKDTIDKYSYIYFEGLEGFGNEVLENVWKEICEEYPLGINSTEPFLIEQAYHQRFMYSRTHVFVGREDILKKITDYLEGIVDKEDLLKEIADCLEGIVGKEDVLKELADSKNDTTSLKPLIVMGEPGSGKSALMAVASLRDRNKQNGCCNITRFIGASPASLDINKLIQSIIREIVSYFGMKVEEERIENIKGLYEYFREIIFSASTKGKLNIFIDAVNQLRSQFDPHLLVWLPKVLPQNVKIVLSSIESDYTINAAKHELPFVHVGALAVGECKKILHKTLEENRKTLTDKQIEMLLCNQDAAKPLYLKVACEELRVFPSFELIDSRIARLPNTIEELFLQFINRLEEDHPPVLVKDTLCLIASSMHGLLESELLELLKPDGKEKLPVNVWSMFYRNLLPYLINAGDEKEGLLGFFHLQLSIAVHTKYLKNQETINSYYKRLADYGLLNYNLKNNNTMNTVLHTGIFLYQSLEENALYRLLRNLFIEDIENYSLYKGIAENLYDWVVNNYDFEGETILKNVSLKLAKDDFPYQFCEFLEFKGNKLGGIGRDGWQLFFHIMSLQIIERLEKIEPSRVDLKLMLARNLHNLSFLLSFNEKYDAALAYSKRSLEIIEQLLVMEPERTDIRSFLAKILSHTGSIIYDFMKNEKKALIYYERALEINKALADSEPTNVDFQSDLASIYNIIGCLYLSTVNLQAPVFFVLSLNVLDQLLILEPGREDFIFERAGIFNNMGTYYKSKGEKKKASEYFKMHMNSIARLLELRPDKVETNIHYAMSCWNMYNTSDGAEKSEWLMKTKEILDECVASDFQNQFLKIISEQVNREMESYIKLQVFGAFSKYFSKSNEKYSDKENDQQFENNNNSTDFTKIRIDALDCYQSGDFRKAKKLLNDLLLNNFEVLSTRLHLARLAVIMDDLPEAVHQTNEVWKMRNEAENYVFARMLWFRLCLEFLNASKKVRKVGIFSKIKSLFKKNMDDTATIIIEELKMILQKKDALVDWNMLPLLTHIQPQLTENQYSFLSALVDVMSVKQNLEKMNDFKEWGEL